MRFYLGIHADDFDVNVLSIRNIYHVARNVAEIFLTTRTVGLPRKQIPIIVIATIDFGREAKQDISASR